MNLNGISIQFLYCFYTVFMLFRPIFVLFSDNSKAIFLQFYPVFAFLHPIFDVFSQYIRAIFLFFFCVILILFSKYFYCISKYEYFTKFRDRLNSY